MTWPLQVLSIIMQFPHFGIEIFFSTLSKADFTMTGCPKAVQIHQIIPIMMEYNTQKHNPNKIFKMDSRRPTPYPCYNLDVNITENNSPMPKKKYI